MNGIAWVDGEILASQDAKVPVMDRGNLLGDGLFETLRTVHGEVFRRDDHLERLRHGLDVLGVDTAVVVDYDRAMDDLLAVAGDRFAGDVTLRLQVSTGRMEDVPGMDATPFVTGLCRPFKPYPDSVRSGGVALAVATQRKDASDPLSTVKSLSFLPYTHARREALRNGADDALLLNTDGRVAEASTSNIIAIQGDTLHAPGPSEGALAGITRKAVLELAEGMQVQESLTLDALKAADEAFLTNTSGGIYPAIAIVGAPIGNGTMGPITGELQSRLDAMMRGAA